MGTPKVIGFDEVATVFADYGTSLRGYIRYKLIQKNLEPFTAGAKLRVLDVGGGNGPDTGWLAQRGHFVTLLEPSAEQRVYAKRRFNFFLSAAARGRITIAECTLAELPPDDNYDLVLLHGVAMYQADPHAFITEAAKRAKPGGLISLVEKNYYGAEARAIRRQDFEALRSLRRTKQTTDLFGQKIHAFYPEELEKLLTKKVKAEVLQWSGIRVLTDDLTLKVTAYTSRELQQMEEAEIKQGHHPGIRAQGQLLHFIARKR